MKTFFPSSSSAGIHNHLFTSLPVYSSFCSFIEGNLHYKIWLVNYMIYSQFQEIERNLRGSPCSICSNHPNFSPSRKPTCRCIHQTCLVLILSPRYWYWTYLKQNFCIKSEQLVNFNLISQRPAFPSNFVVGFLVRFLPSACE